MTMTTRLALKHFFLRALARMDGAPITRRELHDSARAAFISDLPTDADLDAARRDLETDGYILGATDPLLSDTIWTLTPKGDLAAKRLA